MWWKRSSGYTAMAALVAVSFAVTSLVVSITAAATPAPGVNAAKKLVRAAEAPPSFPQQPALPAAKVRQLRGGTIWFISQSQSIPYFVSVYRGIQDAAKAAGLKAKVVDAQGSATEWNKGVATAIAQRAAGIVLGFPPDQMQPALGREAAKKHIPITDAGVSDVSDPPYPGSVGHVAWSYRLGGKLEADWIIADSGANAHVLAFLSVGYKVQDYRLNGLRAEFRRLCPHTCSVDAVERVPFTQWTEQLPSLTTTQLARNPKINYIFSAADAMVLNIVRALHQTHKTNVKLIASDASSYNLQLVRKGDVQRADIGVSENWIGWASVDAIMRSLTTGKNGNRAVPQRLFAASNLPHNLNSETALFPTPWQARYKALWGLK